MSLSPSPPASAKTAAAVALLDVLSEEKARAYGRLRQLQAALADAHLFDLMERTSGLRENLEELRQHAEDDLGTIMHLLAVIKRPPMEAEPEPEVRTAADEAPDTAGPDADAASPSKPTHIQRPPVSIPAADTSITDEDLFNYREIGDRPWQTQAPRDGPDVSVDHVRGDAMRNGRRVEDGEGDDEDQDTVVPLSSASGRGGRSMRRLGAGGSGGPDSMARSLPVSVPVPEKASKPLELPPELGPNATFDEIHASMQLISKSLHPDTIGELPVPASRRIFEAV